MSDVKTQSQSLTFSKDHSVASDSTLDLNSLSNKTLISTSFITLFERSIVSSQDFVNFETVAFDSDDFSNLFYESDY